MWTADGTPIGGLMVLPDEARQLGAPPHWLPYIAVPDVEASVAQAKGRNGKVYVEPQDVPTVGRFAVLADPHGAVFAVFSPAAEVPGHDGEPKPGEFSWHELATTNWQTAWNFYHALFGWEQTEAMDMGPGGVYQMFGRAGRTLGGMYNKPPEMEAAPHWLCYAKVKSADGAAEQVKANGGQVLNGPMAVPGGDRIAQCLDPQGAAFAVHSVVVAAAAPKPKRAKPAKTKVAKKARVAGRPKAAKAAERKRTTRKGATKGKSTRKKATRKKTVRKKKTTGRKKRR
jgi:predicted enzyme related to lactoylglutathione lyase